MSEDIFRSEDERLHFKHVVELYNAKVKSFSQCLTMLPERQYIRFRITIAEQRHPLDFVHRLGEPPDPSTEPAPEPVRVVTDYPMGMPACQRPDPEDPDEDPDKGTS